MEFLQDLLSTVFIVSGVIFMMVAALGILKLPDFYIRMSAITKAGTMGVGLIVAGIAIYFNELLIATKSFVIISFMMLTAPVAAHIIARAAYRHGIPFWGKNLVDELNEVIEKRDELELKVSLEPTNIEARNKLIDYHCIIPSAFGGSLRKAVLVASEIKDIDAAEGHRALGIVYARDKDYELAEQEFKQAVEVSGGQNRYMYSLGLFYQDIEVHEQANAVFEGIYKKDKREMRALYEIGKTAALSGKNLERGEECLNFYMNIQPPPRKHSLSRACYHMGMIFIKKKEYIMAREFFEKALEHDPLYHDAAYHLNKIRNKK
jgi:multicomponent Na+:H+ antiporter subunit G